MTVPEFRRTGLVALGCAVLVACAPKHGPVLAADGRDVFRIVFVGDSLVHRSHGDHGLLDDVSSALARSMPDRAFDIVDAGVNGNRIADIRDRLQRDVLDLHPSAVVLYWDSDVSDVDESAMSPAEVQTLRADYTKALDNVLQRLVSSRAHVIVSGPTLLGELPAGHNAKDRQADAYRRINRQAATRYGATYVNTRRAFQRARPAKADPTMDRGFLTEDGEHLNEEGTRLVAGLFSRALEARLRPAKVSPIGKSPPRAGAKG